MKDRIRKVMESQRMSQQEFADFIHISPASLSSIFTGRTRPTLAIVEAIKNSLPDISTDWLLFGHGDMFVGDGAAQEQSPQNAAPKADNINNVAGAESVLDFDGACAVSSTPQVGYGAVAKNSASSLGRQVSAVGPKAEIEMPQGGVKNIDISRRSITEIRIFYSDQTWETFVPKK